jgi:hypothetical protein
MLVKGSQCVVLPPLTNLAHLQSNWNLFGRQHDLGAQDLHDDVSNYLLIGQTEESRLMDTA